MLPGHSSLKLLFHWLDPRTGKVPSNSTLHLEIVWQTGHVWDTVGENWSACL